MTKDCEVGKESNVPLETPSHNGAYRGTLPVRVIPPGVGSETQLEIPEGPEKRNKGGARRSFLVQINKLVCHNCGKDYTPVRVRKVKRMNKFCSRSCGNAWWKRNCWKKADRVRTPSKRPTIVRLPVLGVHGGKS